MDAVFLRVIILACLGFLVSIGLGIFIGYKWHEKQTIEDDSDSDYSDSDTEDEEESDDYGISSVYAAWNGRMRKFICK